MDYVLEISMKCDFKQETSVIIVDAWIFDGVLRNFVEAVVTTFLLDVYRFKLINMKKKDFLSRHNFSFSTGFERLPMQ